MESQRDIEALHDTYNNKLKFVMKDGMDYLHQNNHRSSATSKKKYGTWLHVYIHNEGTLVLGRECYKVRLFANDMLN